MSEVTCPGCSKPLPVLTSLEDPWFECPHCQQRVLNAGALRSGNSEWRICVGVLLGSLSALGGVGCVVLIGGLIESVIQANLAYRAEGWELRYLVMACLGPVSCALLFLSGFLFMKAGQRPAGRGARTVGAVSAFLASTLVVAMMIFLLNHISR
jgi:hypothetical protein